jgi:hypothetical protein
MFIQVETLLKVFFKVFIELLLKVRDVQIILLAFFLGLL